MRSSRWKRTAKFRRFRYAHSGPCLATTDKGSQAIHVSDYGGKVVVLTFGARWSGHCREALPIHENRQRKVGSERIAVVAINTDTYRDKCRKMRRRMEDFELPLSVDANKKGIAENYRAAGLPHMILVDKQGRVTCIRVGYSEDS